MVARSSAVSRGADVTLGRGRAAGNAIIARDDKPGQPKVDAGALSNPFDHPQVQVEVEKLTVSELQGLAGDLASQAYSSYLDAVSTVAGELREKKKVEEEKRELYVSIVLSIGLMALGPTLASASTKITGPLLLDKVKTGVSQKASDFVKYSGMSEADAAKWKTEEIYAKLSNDTIDRLAGKFDAEKAKGAVDSLAGKGKDKAAKMAASIDKYETGALYLEQLKNAADKSSKELIKSVRGMSTYDALLGVYNTFNGSSREIYVAQVRAQANNFMEQIAPILADQAKIKAGNTAGAQGYEMVRVDAYGKKRLCFADYDSSQAGYHFKAWVTPDMEKTAEAQNPREVAGSAFLTGLPDPLKQEGKERIVRMNAWGKYRLAVVKTSDEGTVRTDLRTTFVRWIPDDEQAQMEAQGNSTQIGGVMTVDPGSVEGLKAPA
jgi:hypothetical protein